MSDPVGVILAAGAATRMGAAKQLLPYGETTVLGAVVAAAKASRLERVIVVVGNYEDEVRAEIEGEGVELLSNPDPDQGNLSSLIVAAVAVPAAPLLLLMGDMPQVDPAVIDAHLDAWRRSPAWLRVTDYNDGRGHPFMLSPQLVGRLPELKGPKALWVLTLTSATEELPVDAMKPLDINTPEAYEAAVGRLAAEA